MSERVSERISVLIVDDHAVVRHGIRALLEAEGDFEVVGDVGSGA
jgi:DNA-binding NarL/FixJ family response regulator